MAGLAPHLPTAVEQAGIEFGEAAETHVPRFLPDAPPAVLDVLLHDALLQTAGHVAEVGVEQVVGGHGGEAGVDLAGLAGPDLVHGGLHVVVDAPLRDAAQGGEAPGMGVEQHLVALARVGRQHERAAGAELHVGHQDAAPDATDDQPFLAPVKLEGFAQLELQWHVGARERFAALGAPLPDEVTDQGMAAGIALGLDLGK